MILPLSVIEQSRHVIKISVFIEIWPKKHLVCARAPVFHVNGGIFFLLRSFSLYLTGYHKIGEQILISHYGVRVT